MAEYKRKRRSAFKSAPKMSKKRVKRKDEVENIEMSSTHNKPPVKKDMRVVRGKKFKIQRNNRVLLAALSVIIIVVVICQFIMPAGIVETVSNSLALIGSGGYPLSLEGSDTVNLVSGGSYYYLLSNNSIEGYSSGGKKLFSYTHGFENPVLKTSDTRALVFAQNGNKALIFNLNGLKSSVETKRKIKNAAIGDNGTYAFVTESESYAAQVDVYKKNGELVYEWFSSKDLVNNVAVAPTGKKIAVSTISSNVGTYNSKLSVLSLNSSTPEFEKTYEGTAVFTIDTSFRNGFSVLTANEYNFIRWSNFKTTQYKNEYNTSMFRVGNNGLAVLYNRENDKTDNRFAIFTKNGKLKREIQFKGSITDFAIKNQHIYCTSDTKAYILDNDGSFLRQGECGFGVKRICPLGQSAMAIVTDNTIERIKLE